MILYTGKDKVIRSYLEFELGINEEEVFSYPSHDTHYTDYNEELSMIKDCGKDFTSQNIEFIDYLLNSDLEFEVHTLYFEDGEFLIRKLSKEIAKEVRFEMGLELR